MKEKLFSLNKKDFLIQTFKAGGKGGQHQNKTDTGVRITHIKTGICAECRNFASQTRNKREAFTRLTSKPEFKIWLRGRAREVINNRTIEQEVEEMMIPENLKIEIRDGKEWMVWTNERSGK